MQILVAQMETIAMMMRGLILITILSINGTMTVGVTQMAVSNRSILAGVSWNLQETLMMV